MVLIGGGEVVRGDGNSDYDLDLDYYLDCGDWNNHSDWDLDEFD